MTRGEFTKWGIALITYYPQGNTLSSTEAMDLWYKRLQDIPASVAMSMLDKWSETEKWPPTIADVRRICTEMQNGVLPDWSDAWQEVTKAISKYGLQGEEEAYASMSPMTRTAVSKIGWRGICLSENADVIRAQFRQVFQICVNREAEDRQLSPELKAIISGLLEGKGAAQLPGHEEGP